ALALENSMLYVLDVAGGQGQAAVNSRPEPTRRRSEHGGQITDLQFNDDGTLLATAGRDGTVRVLDPDTLRQLTVTPLNGAPDSADSADAVGFADDDRHVLAMVGKQIVAWRCPVCGSVKDLI